MKISQYTKEYTNEISFPLGGIGTGSIGLAGNGGLIDWEIFNKPDKGSFNGFSHFAVKAEKNGKLVDARVICGDIYKNLPGQYGCGFGMGLNAKTMQGFPHFREVTFTGEFPMAKLSFSDTDCPCSVETLAFNPFIPHNDRDSSIPAAFFEISIKNLTQSELDFTVAGTLCNPNYRSVNKFFKSENIKGVALVPQEKELTENHRELALVTDGQEVSFQEYWYRGAWNDSLETYWSNFTQNLKFKNRKYDDGGEFDHSTVAARICLSAGEVKTIRFLIGWYCPVKPDQWAQKDESPALVINFYSYLYKDVKTVAKYCFTNWERLKKDTLLWHNELFSSTLPDEVIEAVSANTAVLKTETSIRIGKKGDFYGWEGLEEKVGSCEGTCTHVWNYAYVLPFLFPKLERGIRENDYLFNQKKSGEMSFRTRIPFGRGFYNCRACADGQFGGIIKTYRDWKISGDTAWLKKIWKKVKKALEYAWSKDNYDCWDADCDGVLEGRQHHTLDMELFGPSAWLEGFYLCALKAGYEMANALNDKVADKYLFLFNKGKEWTKKNLFNGNYFIQKVDLTDKKLLERFLYSPIGESDDAVKNYWNDEAKEIKYQIGDGCELDQLLAQWQSDIVGLGEIFDAEQTHIALKSIFENNFKENMRSHFNPFRLFAVNDESGTVICSYPLGAKKPIIPIPYGQESMHGFEYAFAGLLLASGFVNEGLRVVRSVRARYNGKNRNPWNEIECGSNYARSMSSFALLTLLSGFTFDMTCGKLGFNPVKTTESDYFRCVWSVGSGWGNVIIGKTTEINVFHGAIKIKTLVLPYLKGVSKVIVDEKSVSFIFHNGEIQLLEAVIFCKSVNII